MRAISFEYLLDEARYQDRLTTKSIAELYFASRKAR
jgi:hypothetical protein